MDCPQVLIGARGYNTREDSLNGIGGARLDADAVAFQVVIDLLCH